MTNDAMGTPDTPHVRAAAPPLRDLLRRAHQELELRARRLFALEPFARELERVTRGKRFTIHNDVLWVWALDSRDKLVIDLADWARASSVRGASGFLRVIQANYLPAFGERRAWGRANGRELQELDDETHARSRGRLFPGAGARLLPSDVEHLIAAFSRKFDPLMKDRHANRAHQYEHEQSGRSSIRMLNFPEIRTLVEYAHSVILDLSLVAHGSYFELDNRHASDVEDTAAEVVEMIVLSPQARRHLRESGTPTSRLIDDLHAQDTSPPAEESDDDDDGPTRPTFNDHRSTWRALERLRLVPPLGDHDDA